MVRLLKRAEVQRVYDCLGSRQDRQGWYEDAAWDALVATGAFGDVRSVLEFGCGTGRLAAQLFAGQLPPGARYAGVDLSPTMLQLSQQYLTPWAAQVSLTKGGSLAAAPVHPGGYERIISTYVLDLLPPTEIEEFLLDSHTMLAPGGLLGLVTLTQGRGVSGRAATALWQMLRSIHPVLVGGCRPLDLAAALQRSGWCLRTQKRVQCWGIASQVLWAQRDGKGE